MPNLDLQGSATLAEIAQYYNVSAKTMGRRLKQYRKFFNCGGKKKLYIESELQFIKRVFGEKNKGQ